jgi:hypothetical protein
VDNDPDHMALRVRINNMHVAPRCLVVAVESRMELDAGLDEAVNLLKPTAMTEKVGISVTRLAPGRYEARLNNDVPCGVTIEMWANEPR